VSHAIAQAGQPGAGPLAQALASGERVAKLRVLHDAGQLGAVDPLLPGPGTAQRKCFDKLRTEEN
jgi:hypothetical protein